MSEHHPQDATATTGQARLVWMCALASLLALVAAAVARLLGWLIAGITNLAFHGTLSVQDVPPGTHSLGWYSVLLPVGGGLVVGLMARFGSPAIRGHGIPEAMEQVLFNQSRIPARMTFLKPLSAAIAIGTGGPFGAEGPIIATGGALGSLLGQVLHVSADERKVLLAAGAAAGMSATFGAPLAAVLLAVELLLFEYRARSLIPVALATVVAAAARVAMLGTAPAFSMPELLAPGAWEIGVYTAVGACAGLASVACTRAIYAVEDAFERLPLHWMWWPALGGVVVGLVGMLEPRTLGVGYANIGHILSGNLAGQAALVFILLKFTSWALALGSGTSGGTLAPLFTVGGGLGSVLGGAAVALLPGLHVDVRMAALVGMASIFAGASRAVLASVVFAFETTRQPFGLLPLLGGCTAAYLVSLLLMKHSIMTEKIARRGARVPTDYAPELLATARVADQMSRTVVTLSSGQTVQEALAALGAQDVTHQVFPVVGADGVLAGMLALKTLLQHAHQPQALVQSLCRHAWAVGEDASLQDAAELMLHHGVGRLPVVRHGAPRHVVGILSRSDLLRALGRRVEDSRVQVPSVLLPPSGTRPQVARA